eukprot:3467255-Ditylum_brightwellii.AAC.1
MADEKDTETKQASTMLLSHLHTPNPLLLSLHTTSAFNRVSVGSIPTSGAKLFIAVTSRAT